MQVCYSMHLANVCVFKKLKETTSKCRQMLSLVGWKDGLFLRTLDFSVFSIKIDCLYNKKTEFILKNKYIKILNYELGFPGVGQWTTLFAAPWIAPSDSSVLNYLSEFAQIQVHLVSDAI